MTYATTTDVQTMLGRTLEPDEIQMVDRRLKQIERKILRRIPDLAEQIEAGSIDQADVVDIEADAVARLARNPEGLRAENDGQYGYERSSEAADNRLRILPEEWALLGIRPSRMFQIVPNIGPRR